VRFTVREKFFALGEDNTILDEGGNVAYRVDGKALSLRNYMTVYDAGGTQVAQVHHKLAAMHATYEIDVEGLGTAVAAKGFNPFKPNWTVTVPGQPDLTLRGNLLGHNFTVQRGDATIATVGKAWVSLTNTYGVEVNDGENAVLVLCIVLALEAEQVREERNRRNNVFN
jgi:uncharacterized protein YxjI